MPRNWSLCRLEACASSNEACRPGDRRESAEVVDQPRVLGVEPALLVVRHHPDRSGRPALEGKGNEQGLDDHRLHVGEVLEVALEVREELDGIAIDHRAAGLNARGVVPPRCGASSPTSACQRNCLPSGSIRLMPAEPAAQETRAASARLCRIVRGECVMSRASAAGRGLRSRSQAAARRAGSARRWRQRIRGRRTVADAEINPCGPLSWPPLCAHAHIESVR